jgi:AbrB family looped-hinge helix DNA binding protein
MEVIVRDKGRLTLPMSVRRALGIEEGNSLELEVKGSEVVLRPKDRVRVREARGIAKHRVKLEEIEEALGHEVR